MATQSPWSLCLQSTSLLISALLLLWHFVWLHRQPGYGAGSFKNDCFPFYLISGLFFFPLSYCNRLGKFIFASIKYAWERWKWSWCKCRPHRYSELPNNPILFQRFKVSCFITCKLPLNFVRISLHVESIFWYLIRNVWHGVKQSWLK